MRHVFLSYAHEDEPTVDRVRGVLELWGIDVWMDRESLLPGELWNGKIRAAIREGAFFVACLSTHVVARPTSFVYEELALALEELRLRPDDRAWFIPLRLDECAVPAALTGFQHVDLFPDFDVGASALINALLAGLLPELSPEHTFALGLRHHLHGKLRHFTDMGAAIHEEVLQKWLALLDDRCLKAVMTAFHEGHRRLKATGRPQLDMITEPGDHGKVILLSISPSRDLGAFLRSLPAAPASVGNTYIDFILAFRRSRFHRLPRWTERDFAHVLYFDDENDDLLDMLFLEDPRTQWRILGEFLQGQACEEPAAFLLPMIYPTTLLSSIEAGILRDAAAADDSRAAGTAR